MKNITQHTGKLEIIERMPSSVNGNPRYLISIGGVFCRTMIDTSWVYNIESLNGRKVTAQIGTHYGKATVDQIRFAKLNTEG